MSINDDEDDELNLFKQAVKDVRPIKPNRVVQQEVKKPEPTPRQTQRDEHPVLSARDTHSHELDSYDIASLDSSDLEPDEEQIHFISTISTSEGAEGELSLFKKAVANVRPLSSNRVVQHPVKKPQPIPKQSQQDEYQALVDSLSDHYIPTHELETGEELLYLRDGHSPAILSKLRRGYWVVQKHIDLHGLVSDEARAHVSEFISVCKKRGVRCVRIVHGKGLGSRNKEPILKNKVRGWLMQKDEVIAYAQAKQEDGGSGAVIVLLKT
ncbi:MAG TPA: DNA mismatch repair protein MutS [Methylophilaceae bacterium]|jgi:DNA-nicking Smr family endonuclease|nr:DNA mismatch repair protein MutS [Methylophilaceae bacterium]